MAYTIKELADLAGISTRTLRFYEEKGLLFPKRTGTGAYRLYEEAEVDVLWQILFFRKMGFSLAQIEKMALSEDFDCLEALKEQLFHLEEKRRQLDELIDTVKKTIQKEKGEIMMTDQEKFIGLKKKLVEENEETYGEEARERYGDGVIEESNQKMLGLSQEDYARMKEVEEAILAKLQKAVLAKEDYKGQAGKEIALLHKEWLGFTWPSYSVEAHHGVVQMYMADERFLAYYDKEQPGSAAFLKEAVEYHI